MSRLIEGIINIKKGEPKPAQAGCYNPVYDKTIREKLASLSEEGLKAIAKRTGFAHYFINNLNECGKAELIELMSDISDQPEHVLNNLYQELGLQSGEK